MWVYAVEIVLLKFLCDFYFKYYFLIIIIFAEQLIILFNRNLALKHNNIIKLLNKKESLHTLRGHKREANSCGLESKRDAAVGIGET